MCCDKPGYSGHSGLNPNRLSSDPKFSEGLSVVLAFQFSWALALGIQIFLQEPWLQVTEIQTKSAPCSQMLSMTIMRAVPPYLQWPIF